MIAQETKAKAVQTLNEVKTWIDQPEKDTIMEVLKLRQAHKILTKLKKKLE